jgi:hypothetical protein
MLVVTAAGHSSESRERRCLCKRGCKAAALLGLAAVERAEVAWRATGIALALGRLREMKMYFQSDNRLFFSLWKEATTWVHI